MRDEQPAQPSSAISWLVLAFMGVTMIAGLLILALRSA
jgi:hypothetical protein